MEGHIWPWWWRMFDVGHKEFKVIDNSRWKYQRTVRSKVWIPKRQFERNVRKKKLRRRVLKIKPQRMLTFNKWGKVCDWLTGNRENEWAGWCFTTLGVGRLKTEQVSKLLCLNTGSYDTNWGVILCHILMAKILASTWSHRKSSHNDVFTLLFLLGLLKSSMWWWLVSSRKETRTWRASLGGEIGGMI